MAFKSGSNDFNEHRNQRKAENGGTDNPGWTNAPTKNWDDDASYTRPETGPSPYEWIYEDEEKDESKEGY